ncbi:MAG: DinB family protein [Gemmatimonadaceae bacterium]|nr:DinB family protein [Gemmatimonadaceae bacterium]
MTTPSPTDAGIRTGSEIRSALRALHDESAAYWGSLDTRTFLAPVGAAWSPADNVRHLTKSVRAVTQALRLPRLVLWIAFGRAGAPSRSYDAVREDYRARLVRGASAGRFAPRPQAAAPAPEAARARIMASHAAAIEALCAAIARWPEPALDAHRLPHPLIGRLTVREMLLFTVYHNRHHLANVQRRFAGAAVRA